MTVSSSGRGESFVVNPLVEKTSESRLRVGVEEVSPGGTERILLAEDDAFLRKSIQRLLTELGYHVRAFASGQEVLTAISGDSSQIDLLLTDHEMPGLTGYELAQLIRAERPGVHVLFASGCSKESIAPHGQPKDSLHFLRKPYSMKTLAHKLRHVLDGAIPE